MGVREQLGIKVEGSTANKWQIKMSLKIRESRVEPWANPELGKRDRKCEMPLLTPRIQPSFWRY